MKARKIWKHLELNSDASLHVDDQFYFLYGLVNEYLNCI